MRNFCTLPVSLFWQVPLFAYLLNGGLYIRDKVMIPFLPLLCYLIATYLEKQKRREISFWAGALPFLLTIVLVYMGREQGKYSEYLGWVLVDALVMLVCYLIFYWKKFDWVLIVGSNWLFGAVWSGAAQKCRQDDRAGILRRGDK